MEEVLWTKRSYASWYTNANWVVLLEHGRQFGVMVVLQKKEDEEKEKSFMGFSRAFPCNNGE